MLNRLSQLQCDNCDTVYPDEPSPKQPPAIRSAAEREGWESASAKDVCPQCVAQGVKAKNLAAN